MASEKKYISYCILSWNQGFHTPFRVASVGIGLHLGEGIKNCLTSSIIPSEKRWSSNRAGNDYNDISLGPLDEF